MSADLLPPLLVWRQSYPFNYMEFVRRVLGEASAWLALRTPAVIYMPLAPANTSVPSYVRDILKPFANSIETSLSPAAMIRSVRAAAAAAARTNQARRPAQHLFSSAMLCCIKKPAKLNAADTRALIERIVAAHGVDGPHQNANSSSSTSTSADVLLVDRLPPAWATPTSGRRLIGSAKLLRGCQRSSYRSPSTSCAAIDFGRIPFHEALVRLRAATALVGIHGAGLTNAIFLPPSPSSTVVEILPQALASMPNNFAAIKFGFLKTTFGLRHVRLPAPEASPSCVAEARGVRERLRDCDVRLDSWSVVEKAMSLSVR